MPRPLGNETIIIIQADLATSTRDNSKYRDWANATQTTVTQCNVQPFILSEKLLVEVDAEREFLKQVWRVWVPISAPVVAYQDRCIWRGVEYEVLGNNGIWNHISGQPHHRDFMIRLRRG